MHPPGPHPWITEEATAAPAGDDDAIVVAPRSARLLAAVVAVVTVAVVAVGVVRSGGGHGRRTAPPAATKLDAPPVGGKQLLSAAKKLCAPTRCRVEVLDAPVLAWFESASADAVEGDGYGTYGPNGLTGFVAHLYTGQAVTLLCFGRRATGHGPSDIAPLELTTRIGITVFSTTLFIRRDGWDVTITLIAGRAPTLATKSAQTWLRTAALP